MGTSHAVQTGLAFQVIVKKGGGRRGTPEKEPEPAGDEVAAGFLDLLLQGLQRRAQRLLVRKQGIGVEKQEVLPLRGPCAGVHLTSPSLLTGYDPQWKRKFRRDAERFFNGGVGGPPVAYQHFQVRAALIGKAAQQGVDERRLVEGGDDDRKLVSVVFRAHGSTSSFLT